MKIWATTLKKNTHGLSKLPILLYITNDNIWTWIYSLFNQPHFDLFGFVLFVLPMLIALGDQDAEEIKYDDGSEHPA